MQESEEHDDGDALLSLVSSLSRELAHMFDGAHLFACHGGALIPAKRQTPSAQRKELGFLQARPDASRLREAELEDERAALEMRIFTAIRKNRL